MPTQRSSGEGAVATREQFAVASHDALIKMDGGPIISPTRIQNRFGGIRRQAIIGLTREGEPTTADGGLLAIRTGNESTLKEWKDVAAGKASVTYVGDYGSTNWKVARTEKEKDGSISKRRLKRIVYPDDQVREITVSEFLDNMVNPIVEAYQDRASSGTPDDQINIGIQFGFPHGYEEHDGRTDAIIIDVAENGEYSKNWKFTDWDKDKKVNVTELVTERLRERGVNVAAVVIKNDTDAVGKDENAAQKALAQRNIERNRTLSQGEETPILPQKPELVVLKAGFIGGGGTNGAAGDINLELGRAIFEDEEDGAVHETMRELGLVGGDKIAEQETGAMIIARTVSTLVLLDEKYRLLDGGKEYAMKLLEASKTDQAIIDKIAYPSPEHELGELEPNETTQDVARGELFRAGQAYGVLIANTIAAALPEEGADQNVQYGLRCGGSVLLNGVGIKEVSITVAQELLGLNHLPELIEADGDLGVASVAMRRNDFTKAV